MGEYTENAGSMEVGLWRGAPWPPEPPLPQTAKNRADAAHHPAETIQISNRQIRREARRMGPGHTLLLLWVRQRYREFLIRQKQVDFRSNDNGEARIAYRAMAVDEFTDINSLQAWANWRTIPRNLSRRLPNRPLAVLDLCCGVGQSTAVLAHYCPSGSRILGLEANPAFVEVARRQSYRAKGGEVAPVAFRAQSVLERFRDQTERELPAGSVDLVNAVGAIGCHFRPDATEVLVRECSRVLRLGGLALLDAGREGTNPQELIAIAKRCGLRHEGRARSCILDRHWQLCFVKP